MTKCSTLSHSAGEGFQWIMVSFGHGSSLQEDQNVLIDQSKDKRRLSKWREYGSTGGDSTGDTCPTCHGIGRIPRGTLDEDMWWLRPISLQPGVSYFRCVWLAVALALTGVFFRSGEPTGGSHPLQWPETETEAHVSLTSTARYSFSLQSLSVSYCMWHPVPRTQGIFYLLQAKVHHSGKMSVVQSCVWPVHSVQHMLFLKCECVFFFLTESYTWAYQWRCASWPVRWSCSSSFHGAWRFHLSSTHQSWSTSLPVL